MPRRCSPRCWPAPRPPNRPSGLTSPLPDGAQLVAVAVSGAEVTVDLRLPAGFLQNELDPYRSDAIVEQVVKTLHPLGLHHVHVRAEDEAGAFRPLSDFLPRPEVPTPTTPPNDDPAPDRARLARLCRARASPRARSRARRSGSAPGTAGTGATPWAAGPPSGGNNYGLVEDFSNAEAVNYYLARYLWNAGADVWLVRERAMTEHEIIVDNDDGAPAYVETGAWTTSGSPGYNGGTYRYAMTAGSASATATWTPDLPEAGWYAVWAWYRHGTNRPADARYQIHHAGGVTTVRLSQEVHGQTWRYLGEYYFEAGTSGHVTLLNESDDPGQAVIADAIRFGGGLGSIAGPGRHQRRAPLGGGGQVLGPVPGRAARSLWQRRHRPAPLRRVGDGQGLPRRGGKRRLHLVAHQRRRRHRHRELHPRHRADHRQPRTPGLRSTPS